MAANALVARVEADAVVLDHLRQQERQAEQEREHQPAWRPVRFPRLIDCVAQCIVKLEVTRMQRVDARDVHRQLGCSHPAATASWPG